MILEAKIRLSGSGNYFMAERSWVQFPMLKTVWTNDDGDFSILIEDVDCSIRCKLAFGTVLKASNHQVYLQ